MTNEEAREQLKDIARSFSREYFHDWREALDVAIKALEQQPSSEDIKEAYLKGYDYGVKDWFKSKTQPCEDVASKQIRGCENCIHHTENGCSSWECVFEPKEGEAE